MTKFIQRENDLQFDVVCIGETMAMISPAQRESLEVALEIVIRPAGAESNVAMYLANLGHRVCWVSRLGDDPLGRRILRQVSEVGVDTSLVEMDDQAPTGVAFKDPGPGHTQVFYYRHGSAASAMSAQMLEPILRHPPRIAHFTGITPALSQMCDSMTSQLFQVFRGSGTVVSFDVNFRKALWPRAKAAARLLELAQQADIVFVGLDEARELWNLGSSDEVRNLIDQPAVLVIKDGSIGATVYHGEGREFVPALHVAAYEIVGAGDAFAAGWLSGFLQNFSQSKRLRFGHLLAGSAMSSTADHQSLSPGSWIQAALAVSEEQWVNIKPTFKSTNALAVGPHQFIAGV